ncbi:hypothetical protein ABK040_009123 [Willaertia magna]
MYKKQLKPSYKNDLIYHHLDSRWIPIKENIYQFKFPNEMIENINLNQTFSNTTEKLSSISINQLIKDMNELNNELKLSTEISSQWINSNNLIGNHQKQRKIKQLKHDLYMAKRRNLFREKMFKQKSKLLNKKLIDDIPILNKENNLEEDSMMLVLKKEIDEERKGKENYHIIQDFDLIQQIYREAEQDALELEYEQTLFSQKTNEMVEQERQTLEKIIHQYYYGPYYREEAMRKVNKDIFMDFDDDSFLSAFKKIEEDESLKNSNVVDDNYLNCKNYRNHLPKLPVLSMKTEEEREYRRNYFLYPCGSEESKEKDLEFSIQSQRTAGILSFLLKNNNQ